MDTDVLVVGAGPVGLLLAAELGLAGVNMTVVEELAEPSTAQKARGVGPLGAEALRRRRLGRRLDAHNRTGRAEYRQHNGADQGHFAWIHKLGAEAMPEPGRPHALIWQSELERLLAEHAVEQGVQVLREHVLTGLSQDDDQVVAEVDTPAGPRRFTASYLVGCDGAHSAVRKLTGFEFAGTDPVTISRVARIRLAAPDALPPATRRPEGLLQHGGAIDGWARVRTTEFAVQLDPYLGGHNRAAVTAGEIRAAIHRITGAWVDITDLSDARRTLDHARQATTYRIGRVLLAGDAAHVHSPTGSQGVNLGLMDAVNLGWKLASVIRGNVLHQPLDTYTAERHPVGDGVLRNTRAQAALLPPGPFVDPVGASYSATGVDLA